MKKTQTPYEVFQDARTSLLAKTFSEYARRESLGLEVTADDAVTEFLAELIAEEEMEGEVEQGPGTDPSAPGGTPGFYGEILRFPKWPSDLPHSA